MELHAIWRAPDKASTFHNIVRMLAVTAQRRDEVAEMAWSEISDDLTTWTILAVVRSARSAKRPLLASIRPFRATAFRCRRSAGVWVTGDWMVPALAVFTTAEMAHGGRDVRHTTAATA
jgi:integrase